MIPRPVWFVLGPTTLLALGVAWARQDPPLPSSGDPPPFAVPSAGVEAPTPEAEVRQLSEAIARRRIEDDQRVRDLIDRLTTRAEAQRAELTETESALAAARSLLGDLSGRVGEPADTIVPPPPSEIEEQVPLGPGPNVPGSPPVDESAPPLGQELPEILPLPSDDQSLGSHIEPGPTPTTAIYSAPPDAPDSAPGPPPVTLPGGEPDLAPFGLPGLPMPVPIADLDGLIERLERDLEDLRRLKARLAPDPR